MHYLLIGILILFNSLNSYAQDTVETAVEDTVATTVKEKSIESLSPMKAGYSILSDTFRPYRAERPVNNGLIRWQNKKEKQENYNVSLVGVNINSWIKHPAYFNTLKAQAKNFPVKALLDNLQSNNPNLTFNDPTITASALREDVYTPYWNIIKEKKEKPVLYSDITDVVSYTRRFYIYGAAAGGLPYFGRPMEGGKREINLGVVGGQIDEIAVKLPETDIFLVAMLNIIPNWLEEGLDVFQVSQQRLEILVYAFDRNGNVLGGAGIPVDFLNKGQHYTVAQSITSKVWQAGTSRTFYLWPSYQIKNTEEKAKEKFASRLKAPIDIRPTLNGEQKYILHAISQLREAGVSLETDIYDEKGDRVLKKSSLAKREKASLADRKMVYRTDPNEKSTQELSYSKKPFSLDGELTREELLVRLQKKGKNKSKDRNKSNEEKINLSAKEERPSNEGAKIASIVTYAGESLTVPLFTHTNELYYTNNVLPYELETDPIIYKQERKKYAIMPHNVREYKKQFKKETKKIVNQRKLERQDKEFWYKYQTERLEVQGEFPEEAQKAYKKWKSKYRKLTKTAAKRLKSERKKRMYVSLLKDIPMLEDRSRVYLKDKYITKEEKSTEALVKLEVRTAKIKEQSQKIIDKIDNTKMVEKHNLAIEEEKEKREIMHEYIPVDANFMKEIDKDVVVKFVDIASVAKDDPELIKQIAQLNGVAPELVAVAFSEGKNSPIYKKTLKDKKKKEREIKRKMRSLYYEGFSLGLSGSWKAKTSLKDRMDYL